MIFAAYVLCNLGLTKLKTERQTVQKKTSPKSYKTHLKILANPAPDWEQRPLLFSNSVWLLLRPTKINYEEFWDRGKCINDPIYNFEPSYR